MTSPSIDLKFESEFDWIKFLINLNQSIWKSDDDNAKWLSNRELTFATCTVMSVLDGYTNPNSEEMQDYYRRYFNESIKSSDIHGYLSKLQGKDFLTYDREKKRIELPPFWAQIQKRSFTILLTARYPEPDRGGEATG